MKLNDNKNKQNLSPLVEILLQNVRALSIYGHAKNKHSSM